MSVIDDASDPDPVTRQTVPDNPSASPPAGETIDGDLAQHHRQQFEVARHIEHMLGQLGTMARAAELRHLVYFLDLTRQEASAQTQRSRPGR